MNLVKSNFIVKIWLNFEDYSKSLLEIFAHQILKFEAMKIQKCDTRDFKKINYFIHIEHGWFLILMGYFITRTKKTFLFKTKFFRQFL